MQNQPHMVENKGVESKSVAVDKTSPSSPQGRHLEFTADKEAIIVNGGKQISCEGLLDGAHGLSALVYGNLWIKAVIGEDSLAGLYAEYVAAKRILAAFGEISIHKNFRSKDKYDYFAMPALSKPRMAYNEFDDGLQAIADNKSSAVSETTTFLIKFSDDLAKGLGTFIHGNGMVCIDVALENILFASTPEKGRVAIPFNYANVGDKNKKRKKILEHFREEYAHFAPEIFGDSGDFECQESQDVFSLGIAYFKLLDDILPKIKGERSALCNLHKLTQFYQEKLNIEKDNQYFHKNVDNYVKYFKSLPESEKTPIERVLKHYLVIVAEMCHFDPKHRPPLNYVHTQFSKMVAALDAVTPKVRQLRLMPQGEGLHDGQTCHPLEEELGNGCYGKVRRYGKNFVVKSLERGPLDGFYREAELNNEVFEALSFGSVTAHCNDGHKEHKSECKASHFIAMPALPNAIEAEKFFQTELWSVINKSDNFLDYMRFLIRFCRHELYAVMVVHKLLIVHGDIKSDNMVLADDPLNHEAHIVVPIDFGKARKIGEDRPTMLSEYKRQCCQFAPELFGRAGRVKVDYPQDIFSLGIAYFFLFSDMIEVLHSKDNKKFASLRTLLDAYVGTLNKESLNKRFEQELKQLPENTAEDQIIKNYLTLILNMCRIDPSDRLKTKNISQALTKISQEIESAENAKPTISPSVSTVTPR